MTFPAKLLYLFLQMPQNTFLALTIYSATEALYPHYVTTVRSWGPTPLADQQAAGAIDVAVGRPDLHRGDARHPAVMVAS